MLFNIGEWAVNFVLDAYGYCWGFFERLLAAIGMYHFLVALVVIAIAMLMLLVPLRGSGFQFQISGRTGASDGARQLPPGKTDRAKRKG